MAKRKVKDFTLEAVLKQHIERVLRMTNHNRSQAATVLGIPLSTLRSQIKKTWGKEHEKRCLLC
jgi:DNA-binding protein Fis